MEQGVEPRLLRRQAAGKRRQSARGRPSRTAPGKPALLLADALRSPWRRAAMPPGSVDARWLRRASASPQFRRNASRSWAGCSTQPCSRVTAPAAAHSRPSMKIAPRWVLTPPVAASMRASASMPQSLQHCEIGAVESCFCDLDEVVPQREQAAHEGVRVHVVVAAAVDQGHQARLGCQRQFVVQRERGSASDRRGRETPGCAGARRAEAFMRTAPPTRRGHTTLHRAAGPRRAIASPSLRAHARRATRSIRATPPQRRRRRGVRRPA